MYFLDEYIKKVNEKSDSYILTDSDGMRSITYGDFNKLTDRIINKLTSNDIKTGNAVIIILPRCSEYIATEIALLKMGCVIVPLIPEYPEDRVDYIEKDCKASYVIKKDFFDDIDDYSDSEVKALEKVDADNRGMIIYTSGSTGNPKGVVYKRSNIDAQVIRKLDSVKGIEPLTFAASATMSFCVTVTEYFRAIALGGHVHIISDEVRSDAALLSEYYAKNNITSGFISPRILRNFVSKNNCLKRVFTASEKVVNIYSDDYEIINSYGQSETVGTILEFNIDKLYDNTPIGKPLSGVEVIIADSDDNEIPDGEEGQICLIGNLPCEYNNLPEQTEKTFKTLSDGRIFIHSGDIGKKLPDGNVQYLNRNDWMIKVHGQRVEPGEIESVMNKVHGVTGSIVKAFENEDGTMLLCGFYTESEPVNKENIINTLNKKLPHYMIPGVFVKMDAFPVNANGKIDRKSINKPDLSANKAEYEAPENDMEAKVCKAMETVLKIDRLGRKDDFYILGGNSINAVLLAEESGIEGLTAQHVLLGKTPKGIIEKYNEMNAVKKPEMKKADKDTTEFSMTNAHKYQLNECDKIGCEMDINDFRGFWKIEKGIDIDRLKASVLACFSESDGMNISFDKNKKLIYRTGRKPEIGEITVASSEFEKFRRDKNKVVRDLLNDELYELYIIHVDEDDYLYININHLLFDESSVKNLVREIEARYENREFEKEDTDIFDLSLYEKDIKSSNYYKEAISYYESIYSKITEKNIPPKDEKQDSACYRKVATDLNRDKIEAFLKKNGVSEIIYLQAAFAMALSKTMLNSEKLTYMTVYDGRIDAKYRNIKGVLARSIYMYTEIDKSKSINEFLNEIQDNYQKMSYFDTVDIVEISDKYPNIKNDIYLNFRASFDLDFELDGKSCKYENIGIFYDDSHVMTRLNFVVDYTEDKHYVVVATAGYNDKSMVESVIDEFEKMLIKLIEAKNVLEII